MIFLPFFITVAFKYTSCLGLLERTPVLRPPQSKERKIKQALFRTRRLSSVRDRSAMDFNRKTESLLARQGSVYNLTFDQFQNSMGGIGKDFGSMNMDELLKNIWTAEETQAMASATQVAPRGGIQRQGSLTLPRTLSQKTVDEVWKDLVRENTTTTSSPVPPPGDPLPNRQQTLGEMTLEEFLVRAGVDINLNNTLNNNNTTNNINNNNNNIASSSGNTNNNSLFFGGNFLGNNNHNNNINNINNNNSVMPMAMPIQAIQGYGGDQQIVSLALTNGMMPGGMMSPKGNNGEMSSSLSPVNYPFARGKKSGGQVEKVVERRQRRMIKNRESAARSRARKQAYTIELEAEVAKLKEQNEELQKKQAEIMEMQKNQPKEVTNHQCGPKKRCLRRTQTGPW